MTAARLRDPDGHHSDVGSPVHPGMIMTYKGRSFLPFYPMSSDTA